MSTPESVVVPGASLSIWRDGPELDGARTAALGAFSCETAEAGAAAIRAAMEQLRSEGFAAVLGPMDGTTWAKHRLVVESDGRAEFTDAPYSPSSRPATAPLLRR